MPYLIDGYNFLHAVGRLSPKSSYSALESARHWFMHLLQERHSSNDPVTVVFDAKRPPRNRVDPTEVWIQFEYAPIADDRIEDLIETNPTPQKLIVVSNDHRIQQAAQRRHCLVMTCLDYAEHNLLNLRSRQSTPTVQVDPLSKPDRLSEEETKQLLEAFSDLEDDPLLRDLF